MTSLGCGIGIPYNRPVAAGGGVTLLTSLVSWYLLDEDTAGGGDVVDSHGSNTLTDNNTVGTATGKQGKAADFERTNSEYFSIAAASATDFDFGDTSFTIAMWIKPETLGADYYGLISKYRTSTADKSFLLFLRNANGGNIRFAVSGDGTNTTTVDGATNTGSVTAAAWSFVVVWHDHANDLIGIQINNVGTPNTASHSGGLNTSVADFNIGNWDNGTGLYDGVMDEVGVWNRVLTADERTELYSSGSGVTYSDL